MAASIRGVGRFTVIIDIDTGAAAPRNTLFGPPTGAADVVGNQRRHGPPVGAALPHLLVALRGGIVEGDLVGVAELPGSRVIDYRAPPVSERERRSREEPG